MTSSDFAAYKENKRLATLPNADLVALRAANELLRKKYGIGSDSYSYAQLKNYYVNGTNNAAGGLSLVGERGMELLNIPKGSQVISNLDLTNLMKNMSTLVKLPVFQTPNIPKLNSIATGSFSMGNIIINAQSVDNNSISKLANQVASVIKRELNLSGQR
jgi:hypothetical protein